MGCSFSALLLSAVLLEVCDNGHVDVTLAIKAGGAVSADITVQTEPYPST